MQDFTAGGIHALPTRPRKTTGNPELDAKIKEIIAAAHCDNSPELIEQLIMTALKMSRDKISVADLKMFNRSLNEFRYAARTYGETNIHRWRHGVLLLRMMFFAARRFKFIA